MSTEDITEAEWQQMIATIQRSRPAGHPEEHRRAVELAEQMGAPDDLYDELFDAEDPLDLIQQWIDKEHP